MPLHPRGSQSPLCLSENSLPAWHMCLSEASQERLSPLRPPLCWSPEPLMSMTHWVRTALAWHHCKAACPPRRDCPARIDCGLWTVMARDLHRPQISGLSRPMEMSHLESAPRFLLLFPSMASVVPSRMTGSPSVQTSGLVSSPGTALTIPPPDTNLLSAALRL